MLQRGWDERYYQEVVFLAGEGRNAFSLATELTGSKFHTAARYQVQGQGLVLRLLFGRASQELVYDFHSKPRCHCSLEESPFVLAFFAQSSSEVPLGCLARAALFRGHVDSSVKLVFRDELQIMWIIIFDLASTMQCRLFLFLQTGESFCLFWTLQIPVLNVFSLHGAWCMNTKWLIISKALTWGFWKSRNWTVPSDLTVCCQEWP